MSRSNRYRHSESGQTQSGGTQNSKSPWSKVQPQTLTKAYNYSLKNTPELHHPSVVDGSANQQMQRYDFLSWCGGVRSTMEFNQLRQIITGSTARGGSGNLPQNIQSAMQQIGSTRGGGSKKQFAATAA